MFLLEGPESSEKLERLEKVWTTFPNNVLYHSIAIIISSYLSYIEVRLIIYLLCRGEIVCSGLDF